MTRAGGIKPLCLGMKLPLMPSACAHPILTIQQQDNFSECSGLLEILGTYLGWGIL